MRRDDRVEMRRRTEVAERRHAICIGQQEHHVFGRSHNKAADGRTEESEAKLSFPHARRALESAFIYQP